MKTKSKIKTYMETAIKKKIKIKMRKLMKMDMLNKWVQ